MTDSISLTFNKKADLQKMRSNFEEILRSVDDVYCYNHSKLKTIYIEIIEENQAKGKFICDYCNNPTKRITFYSQIISEYAGVINQIKSSTAQNKYYSLKQTEIENCSEINSSIRSSIQALLQTVVEFDQGFIPGIIAKSATAEELFKLNEILRTITFNDEGMPIYEGIGVYPERGKQYIKLAQILIAFKNINFNMNQKFSVYLKEFLLKFIQARITFFKKSADLIKFLISDFYELVSKLDGIPTDFIFLKSVKIDYFSQEEIDAIVNGYKSQIIQLQADHINQIEQQKQERQSEINKLNLEKSLEMKQKQEAILDFNRLKAGLEELTLIKNLEIRSLTDKNIEKDFEIKNLHTEITELKNLESKTREKERKMATEVLREQMSKIGQLKGLEAQNGIINLYEKISELNQLRDSEVKTLEKQINQLRDVIRIKDSRINSQADKNAAYEMEIKKLQAQVQFYVNEINAIKSLDLQKQEKDLQKTAQMEINMLPAQLNELALLRRLEAKEFEKHLMEAKMENKSLKSQISEFIKNKDLEAVKEFEKQRLQATQMEINTLKAQIGDANQLNFLVAQEPKEINHLQGLTEFSQNKSFEDNDSEKQRLEALNEVFKLTWQVSELSQLKSQEAKSFENQTIQNKSNIDYLNFEISESNKVKMCDNCEINKLQSQQSDVICKKNSEYKVEIERLQHQINDLNQLKESEIQALQTQMSQAKLEIERLQSQINDFNQLKIQEAKDSESKVFQAQLELDDLNFKISDKISINHAEIIALENQITQGQLEIERLHSQIKDFSQSKDSEIIALKTQIKQAQFDNNKLQHQINDLNQLKSKEDKGSESHLIQAQLEINNLNLKISDLIHNQDEEIIALENQISQAKLEIERLHSQVKDFNKLKDSEINKLLLQINDINQLKQFEIKSLEAKLSIEHTTNQSHADEKEELLRHIDKIKNENQILNVRVSQITEESILLNENNINSNVNLLNDLNNHVSINNSLKETVQELQEQIRNLNLRLQANEELNKNLLEKIRSLEAQENHHLLIGQSTTETDFSLVQTGRNEVNEMRKSIVQQPNANINNRFSFNADASVNNSQVTSAVNFSGFGFKRGAVFINDDIDNLDSTNLVENEVSEKRNSIIEVNLNNNKRVSIGQKVDLLQNPLIKETDFTLVQTGTNEVNEIRKSITQQPNTTTNTRNSLNSDASVRKSEVHSGVMFSGFGYHRGGVFINDDLDNIESATLVANENANEASTKKNSIIEDNKNNHFNNLNINQRLSFGQKVDLLQNQSTAETDITLVQTGRNEVNEMRKSLAHQPNTNTNNRNSLNTDVPVNKSQVNSGVKYNGSGFKRGAVFINDDIDNLDSASENTNEVSEKRNSISDFNKKNDKQNNHNNNNDDHDHLVNNLNINDNDNFYNKNDNSLIENNNVPNNFSINKNNFNNNNNNNNSDDNNIFSKFNNISRRTRKSFSIGFSSDLLLNESNWELIQGWIESLKIFSEEMSPKLIFKAKRDGYSAKEFQKRCCGVENTLVIARTNFGKTVGGFSPMAWDLPGIPCIKYYDPEGHTFLFSLDFKEKYELISDQYSICISQRDGPIFGGGDFELVDECDKYCNRSVKLGNSFDIDKSAEEFFGASEYLISDYEVYQIILDE